MLVSGLRLFDQNVFTKQEERDGRDEVVSIFYMILYIITEYMFALKQSMLKAST